METQSLTEAQNRLIHAYVEPGGCWHEMIPAFPCPDVTDYKFRGHKCKKCGFYWSTKIEDGYGTPTYTDDAPFSNFQRVLFGEEGMWKAFVYHNHNLNDSCTRLDWADYVVWLFHPDHRDRFCRLFIEFLSLEETQREFGYEMCSCITNGEKYLYAHALCRGTGQVPRPWLKAWKEAQS